MTIFLKCVILFLLCNDKFYNIVVASNLIVYVSQHGLHGEIMFRQMNKTTVEIKANLETTLQYPDQVWSWEVREFPVDYTNIDPLQRCADSLLGRQIVSFDADLEYLSLPGNETSIWYRQMELLGHEGIWSRSLLLTEWLLDVDSRKTKELHDGSCIQMIIHFRGPIAHQLEKDMSSLLAAGRLEAPSLFIPGYNNDKRKKKISYRPCNSRDPLDKREKIFKKALIPSSACKPKLMLLPMFVMSVLVI